MNRSRRIRPSRSAPFDSCPQTWTACSSGRETSSEKHVFRCLPAVRRILEARRIEYVVHRPHMSPGDLTTNKFATRSYKDQNQNGL